MNTSDTLMRLLLARLEKADLSLPKDPVPPLRFTRWKYPFTDANLPDTLEFRGEFGTELACFLPFVYWLHCIGGMSGKKLLTYAGMRPYYYFLPDDQYSEKHDARRHYHVHERPQFTPNLLEHVCFKKPFEAYPDFRSVYRNDIFKLDRPLLVIHNKYNNEWDRGPVNFIGLELLGNLIAELRKRFSIVYIRPGISSKPADFSQDHNTVCEFDDRTVVSSFDDVLIFDDLVSRFDGGTHYNLLKNWLYGNTYHFISAQGGATYHCALFSGSSILVNHRSGSETEFAYAHGLYRHLSNPCPVMLIARSDDGLREGAMTFARSQVAVDRILFDPKDLPTLRKMMPVPSATARSAAIDRYAGVRGLTGDGDSNEV